MRHVKDQSESRKRSAAETKAAKAEDEAAALQRQQLKLQKQLQRTERALQTSHKREGSMRSKMKKTNSGNLAKQVVSLTASNEELKAKLAAERRTSAHLVMELETATGEAEEARVAQAAAEEAATAAKKAAVTKVMGLQNMKSVERSRSKAAHKEKGILKTVVPRDASSPLCRLPLASKLSLPTST